MPADLVSSEGPLPRQMAIFSLELHMVEGERESPRASFIRALGHL